jgi:hypothetical protein
VRIGDVRMKPSGSDADLSPAHSSAGLLHFPGRRRVRAAGSGRPIEDGTGAGDRSGREDAQVRDHARQPFLPFGAVT